ncbi:hypothetical protein N7520_008593 [Penicillium odoratum]|uniref:uncharacterized protein n=1 Tax=Penicillium odoratum TaxID=1167516 RepID=UPI002548024E|nr:uncharacterized protein N7520_008593 [Penicillium odoratum]KAJ5751676.1 hypothetical protein N7520_008593 [Penicillium odoratum]
MTMKAVQFHKRKDVRVVSIPEPECQPGEVKIKPAFVGICGTDLHEYTSGPVLIPEKPHTITNTKIPVTLGHEFSGTVIDVGEGVHHLTKGQRVVVRPTIYDKTCCSCKGKAYHCCDNIGFIGLSGYGGGMAEYMTAPADHFYCIPDSISFDIGALVEPLAVAWHAVHLSPFKAGDTTVVVGGGPIGISIVQVLKLKGAKQIIVVEPVKNRQRLASEFGADKILDPGDSTNISESIRALTEDVGADVILDTAGVEKALNSIIPACRTHASIINIAVWEKRPQVDLNKLMYNEVNFTGAALYDEQAFVDVIQALASGELDPKRMITSKIEIDDVVDQGLEALIRDKEHHCKVLINVGAG